jgi:hypothetical protein
MTYVRFVVARRDANTDHQMGIFVTLYELDEAGDLAPHEVDWFVSIERWLNKNLKRPADFAWSTRPNAPRRAISWMKMSAKDLVAHMRELAELLRHKDIAVEELRTEKPGYLVYEDEFQVTAVPFKDTF